jgi:ubiquitin-protein ligase
MSLAARLGLDLKEITEERTCIEGVYAELITPEDMTRWRVWVEGPDGTPFEGGIFRTTMEFPENYPMAPPTVTFVSDFFHPNVYEDGKVCFVSVRLLTL